MPTNKPAQQQGPDPRVMEAIQRLAQTQLEPLEEVIFQSWMQANQLDEGNSDQPYDYRGLYQQTGGKVFAPGELSNKIQHESAIKTLMQAQEAHDASSPMKMMMDAMGQPATPEMGAAPDAEMGGGGMDFGGSDPGFDNFGGDF